MKSHTKCAYCSTWIVRNQQSGHHFCNHECQTKFIKEKMVKLRHKYPFSIGLNVSEECYDKLLLKVPRRKMSEYLRNLIEKDLEEKNEPRN